MTADSQRSLRVSWDDPLKSAQAGLQLAGIDALRAVESGKIPPPPMATLLGMEVGEVEVGEVEISLTPGEQHYANTGAAHGGLAATLLDSAMFLAVLSTLPEGVVASTLEIKVNYTRPITVDTGRVSARGAVIHRGKHIATADGRITDSGDKLLAHGITTCLIRG